MLLENRATIQLQFVMRATIGVFFFAVLATLLYHLNTIIQFKICSKQNFHLRHKLAIYP